jgi:hypothetical protein
MLQICDAFLKFFKQLNAFRVAMLDNAALSCLMF